MTNEQAYQLGLELAARQAGFIKTSGVLSSIGKLIKKAPPKKGSFAAYKGSAKSMKAMKGSATETRAYGKHRSNIARKERRSQPIYTK